jgi:uncharacterized membrane protein
MSIIYSYFLYFVIYSALGWICETIYCSIIDKQCVNRGFLSGPFCPIYGVGALIIIVTLDPLSNNIIILYIGAMALTSLLEYITGFLLETIFNLKWWDYSSYRYNLKGRVCLLNSILFGVLSLITIKIINPFVMELIRGMPINIIISICNILIAYFLLDTMITVSKVLQLSGRLEEMHVLFEEIKEKSESYKGIVQQNLDKFDGLIGQENEKIIFAKEQINKLKIKLETTIMKNKALNKRIFKAFPNIKSLKYQYSLENLKEELKKIRKNN